MPGSPAGEAGLRERDIIVGYAGESVIGLTQNCPSKTRRRRQCDLVRQGGVTPLGQFCVSPK
ncbi:MAG: PDZ domain-containing protein [Pseudomonadota bacterium]